MARRLASALARRVRLVAFDVDGVLTDAGVYIGEAADGTAVELKRFDIVDGLGLKLLDAAGLHVALVSGRESRATALRAQELGIECFQDPDGHKMAAMHALLERHGVAWEEAAFMGDDLPDLALLRRVGLPVAVGNAVPEVRAVARWVTTRPGGRGAVREFAETLLAARGEWAGLVERYRRERERVAG